MIATMLTPQKPASRRAVEEHSEMDGSLYQSIPDHVDHVPHPDYLCPDVEEELFGERAAAVAVPQWRPISELGDAGEEAHRPQAKASLSQKDEALLFRRYNCARHRLADLMDKQEQCFARSRVASILTWYRRAQENRTALVQANLALVVAMVKRTRIDSVEFEDLVSEGNIALLRAVDKFDFSRGFKFSTYACSAILKAFSRLAAQAGVYRQRFPTNFEPERERSDELERRRANQQEGALDDLQQVLALNRANLTDVEQTVVGARFAVVGHTRVHTLREVSRLVQLSAERVRQVQTRAMTKMRLALDQASLPRCLQDFPIQAGAQRPA